MKKYLLISTIVVMLLYVLLIGVIGKNSKKYVMYDGMMLAMTLTDSNGNITDITKFPDGTNYTVEVDCGNTATGRWLGEEWKLSVEDIKENVMCTVDFFSRTDNDKLSSIVQTVNPSNNNGYRYTGKLPNNYLWFNNEYWRIIGLVPVCTSASSGTCSARTNLVKIIRANSIGGLAYDAKSSEYTGLWGNNTLYTLLNSYYYGKLDGTETEYCYSDDDVSKAKCDYTTIGISKKNTDYYGQMVESVYWNIGVSTRDATSGTVYGTESATVTTDAVPIGLMSASDYGYAADIERYETNLSAYGTTAITSVNWLYSQSYEWTNIQYSDGMALCFFPDADMTASATNVGRSTRPVLYLKSSVYKISGSGTMIDPYVIGM